MTVENETEAYCKVNLNKIMELYRFCNRHADNNCEACPMKPYKTMKPNGFERCMISDTIYSKIIREE
jgi:hypothetical protein